MKIWITDILYVERKDPLNWVMYEQRKENKGPTRLGYYGNISQAMRAAFTLCPDLSFDKDGSSMTLSEFAEYIDRQSDEVRNCEKAKALSDLADARQTIEELQTKFDKLQEKKNEKES